MKILIMYYSYSGNTRSVAGMLREVLNCDVAEIEPIDPYTGDSEAVTEQGKAEVTNGFRPRIKAPEIAFSEYDVIVLGTPVWWYTIAPAMRTAITSFNWAGKIVYPFITHGGWAGTTLKDMKNHCRWADVRPGLDLRFDDGRMGSPQADVEEWVSLIKRAGF